MFFLCLGELYWVCYMYLFNGEIWGGVCGRFVVLFNMFIYNVVF